MVFTKFQFFILLFAILIGPLLIYKLIWLANSKKTYGSIYFMGHDLELNGSVSSHLVILFKIGKDTFTFNTLSDLPFKNNEPVPVRYQKNDPSDAKVNLPDRIWGDTLVYSIAPVLLLLVLFLTPDRFDPLLPGKSKILIGGKPWIKIISP
jgi:hypothetical protein